MQNFKRSNSGSFRGPWRDLWPLFSARSCFWILFCSWVGVAFSRWRWLFWRLGILSWRSIRSCLPLFRRLFSRRRVVYCCKCSNPMRISCPVSLRICPFWPRWPFSISPSHYWSFSRRSCRSAASSFSSSTLQSALAHQCQVRYRPKDRPTPNDADQLCIDSRHQKFPHQVFCVHLHLISSFVVAFLLLWGSWRRHKPCFPYVYCKHTWKRSRPWFLDPCLEPLSSARIGRLLSFPDQQVSIGSLRLERTNLRRQHHKIPSLF